MYHGCVLDEVIKKPTRVQDQTAHDAQGRRRFHGAFTGGFSAGYFNTVGSEQGEATAAVHKSYNLRRKIRLLHNVHVGIKAQTHATYTHACIESHSSVVEK